MAEPKIVRKKGLSCQQQMQFDIHYILDDLDSIKISLSSIAGSLGVIAQCLENNNQ